MVGNFLVWSRVIADLIALLDIPSIMPGSDVVTQELLGWRPVHLGLIEDLDQGHYFNR